ncbi:MAG: hypothetical protein U1E46_12305 [Hyphomicrobiales bacterium]
MRFSSGRGGGTIFTLWDRLFGTYRRAASLPEDAAFGVENHPAKETFGALLLDPFRGESAPAPSPSPLPVRKP